MSTIGQRNLTHEERLAARIVMRLELAQAQLNLAHTEAAQLSDRSDEEDWDRGMVSAGHAAQSINGARLACDSVTLWARVRRNGLRDLIAARNAGRL